MKKTIFLYGILLAALVGFLKFIEYRYWVRDLSMEVYIGVVALFCTGVGIWVGWRLTHKPPPKKIIDGLKPTSSVSNNNIEAICAKYQISKRELEVLDLIAKGHSNKEIAETLLISTNTIKSHSSNIFSKLDVKRRTQAVQKAKEIGLLST